MASAEVGSVPSEVEYGEGCPLSSRIGGLGASSAPPAGSENGFWRILKATERSFLYLYDKNLRGRGQLTLASPTPNSGGLVPRVSRDLRPCALSPRFMMMMTMMMMEAAKPVNSCIQIVAASERVA